jgi:hypothetical protein
VQIARVNHQSAVQCLPALDKLNRTDLTHGYSFCLPVEALKQIHEAAVAPHGVTEDAMQRVL